MNTSEDIEYLKSAEISKHREQAFKHFMHYLDDPTSTDIESGLPNLWHLAYDVSSLIELEDDIELKREDKYFKKLSNYSLRFKAGLTKSLNILKDMKSIKSKSKSSKSNQVSTGIEHSDQMTIFDYLGDK